MKHWKEWEYVTITGAIHAFTGGEVAFSDKDRGYTKRLESWESIISHCVDRANPTHICTITHPTFGTLIAQFHKDANAQIIIETLDEWAASLPNAKSKGLV